MKKNLAVFFINLFVVSSCFQISAASAAEQVVEKKSQKKHSHKNNKSEKEVVVHNENLVAAETTTNTQPESQSKPTSEKHLTSGHYVGFDLLRSSLKFYESYTRDSFSGVRYNPKYSNVGYGAGLNYKYAFNFDGVFLAPGVFFEQHDTATRGNTSVSNAYLNQLRVKNRYGVKADFGYDVTDRIAPYFTGGYSKIYYNAHNTITRTGITYLGQKDSTVGDWFYGAGLKFRYNNDISINLEYNTQKFRATTAVADTKNYNGIYHAKLSIAKIGILYNF